MHGTPIAVTLCVNLIHDVRRLARSSSGSLSSAEARKMSGVLCVREYVLQCASNNVCSVAVCAWVCMCVVVCAAWCCYDVTTLCCDDVMTLWCWSVLWCDALRFPVRFSNNRLLGFCLSFSVSLDSGCGWVLVLVWLLCSFLFYLLIWCDKTLLTASMWSGECPSARDSAAKPSIHELKTRLPSYTSRSRSSSTPSTWSWKSSSSSSLPSKTNRL